MRVPPFPVTKCVSAAVLLVVNAAAAADWDRVPALDAAPADGPWAVSPATFAATGEPLEPKVVALPNRENFFETFGGIAAVRGGSTALIGYTLDPPGRSVASTTRLAAVDLNRGRVSHEATAAGLWVPLGVDLAPGGNGRGAADLRVLVRSDEFQIGEKARLEVWRVSRRDVLRGRSWTPYPATGSRFDSDIDWAAVARGRALTLSDEGRLAAWDLDAGGPLAKGEPPALWTLELATGGMPRGEQTPAISPSGTHLAVLHDGAVLIVDLAAGTTVAAIPGIDGYAFPRLAFSRDGARLALLNGRALRVFDMRDGSLATAAVLPEAPGRRGGALDWVGPRCVLIGGELLVDVDSRLPLWRYEAQAPPAVAGGAAWFPLAETGAGQRTALAGYDLPHPEAAAALEKAKADPDFLVLKAGDRVRVDASAVPPAGRDEARAGLEAAVTGGGYVLADDAPAVLAASVERTDPRTVRYGRSGFNLFPEDAETVTVRDYRYVFGLTVDGAEVWRSGYVQSTAPHRISLERGQSVADALRQYDVPDYGRFAGRTLPEPVLRPSPGTESLGESEVTNEGFRPVPKTP